ncbi:hypothetical protein DFP73DRAFT_534593 [Morchella snyderi]|nr:hypothetical protein DFP73DRAFT_534593 [Morchella snyderi]
MRNIGGNIPAPRDVISQRRMHRGLSRTPSGPNGQWPNQEAAGNLRTLQSQGSLAGRAAIHQPFGGNQHRIATGPRNNFRQGDSSYQYSGSVDLSENGPTNTGGHTHGNNRGYANGSNRGYTNGNNGGYINGDNRGYINGRNGGYTNDRNGGYINGRNGGYINGNNEGYTNDNNKGYTSDRGTIARQQLAAPSAKFPGSVRTDSSAHGSVGSPVGRDLQPGYSTPINKSIHSPSPASGVHNLRQGRPFQAGSESLGYSSFSDDNRPSDNIARTSRQDHSWTPGLDKRGETDYQIDSGDKLQDRESFQSTANGKTTVTLASHTPSNRRVENNYSLIDQPQHAEKRTLVGPLHIPALKCRDVGNYNSGRHNSGLGSGLHTNQSLIYAICPPKSDPDDHQPGIFHYSVEGSDSGSESTGRYTPEPAQPADLHMRYSPDPSVDRSALRLFYDHEREAKKESNPDAWLEILSGKNESTEKKATKWSHAASTDTVFDDVKASLPESITDKERTRSEDPILAAPNLQKPDQFTKGNRGVAEEKPGDRGFNPVPPSLPAPEPPTPSLPAPAPPTPPTPPTPSLPALAPPTPPEPPEPPASPAPSLPASAPPTPPTPSATRPALSTHPRPGSGLPPPATLLSLRHVTGPPPNLKPKNRNTKEKLSALPTVPGVPGVPGSVSDPIRAPAPVRVSTSVRIPDNAPISPPKWVENAKVTPSPYPRVAKENPKGGPSTTPQTKTCWLCGGNHGGPCEANVLVSSKTRRNQVNDNDNGTWDYQGINKPWSEDEVTEKQEARKTGKKSKCRIRKAHAARDLPDQDDNGGVLLGKFMGTEAAQPTKLVPKKREKKKTTRGGVVLNGGVERAESAPEELLEAPKFDGPKSVMARADRSHIGRYSDGAVTGIRKLSEDNLTTIFSYLADGLMPEDQMETKNVHIGNSFKFDTSFTTTRYRRLRAVLRSCHYWRHLGQQIVCKYVNLNKLPSFELFVRTISEDEELGNMVRAIKVNIHGGASYMAHDRRASKQVAEMPKVGDLAQLFIRMMHSCPQLQVLSVNMHGAIMGFNLVIERFPMMREIQIKDDRSKGIVARNIWINLARNYPNLENFRIFHCQENAATNFDNLKFSPKFFQLKGGNEIILKALTMERCPEISDKGLAALCPKLKNLTTLVIVDCKLVTSGGLARAIEKLPDPSRITRLIYFVWVDPFGNSTADEMSYTRSHLCSTIRKCCTNVSYLCWKPYRICGDFWKDSNFHSLERCRIEPMSFRDCDEDVNDHSKFTEAYQQARDQERLPKLKEDRVFFDFYF